MTSMLALTARSLAQPSALPEFTWSNWSGDGTLRAGLLLLAGLYLLGVGPLRRRFKLGPPVGWGRMALYLSGVLCLAIALEGPIHELSDNYLFSAHMVQHMLLIYAAPPLMLLGTPGWLLRPLLRLPGVFPIARALTRPIPALILFNVVFSLYHIPLYYNVVVMDHRLHIAAHLLFIGLAMLTWWPILSPLPELPRLSYPLQMLYVFGQTFSGFVVGSFITNAQVVLYPFYADAPRVWGLSAMDDQKVGGLIMWVIGGVYLLCVFSAIFFAWARAEGVHDDVAVPIRRRALAPHPSNAPEPTTSNGTDEVAAGVGGQGTPRRVIGSPTDLGARHVVTSAPDRSRLN